MLDRRVLNIFKFGLERHIRDFRDNGHIYMNPLSYFVRLEEDESRSDPNEALTYNLPATGGKLNRRQDGEWIEMGTIAGSVRYSHDEDRRGNVFCMYALCHNESPDTTIDPRNFKFGDTFAVIVNAEEFLRRVAQAAAELDHTLRTDMVEYVDSQTYRGKMGIFRKFSTFAYQSEFRLALVPGKEEPYDLCVGSLSDIVKIGPLRDINERMVFTPGRDGLVW